MDLIRPALEILNGSVTRRINFHLLGVPVNWQGYRKVADCIENTRIALLVDPSVGNYSEYRHFTNELVVSRPGFPDFDAKANLIHECTHALMDWNRMRFGTAADSEVVAYVAHTMYFLLNDNRTPTNFSGTPEDESLFMASWIVAQKLQRGEAPTTEDVNLIRNWLLTVPKYHNYRFRSMTYRGI